MKSKEILPISERVGLDQKVIEALGECEYQVTVLEQANEAMTHENKILKNQVEEVTKSAQHWKQKSELSDGFYLVHSGTKYPVMKIGELPEPVNYARMALDVDKLSNHLLTYELYEDSEQLKELSKSILMFLSKQS